MPRELEAPLKRSALQKRGGARRKIRRLDDQHAIRFQPAAPASQKLKRLGPGKMFEKMMAANLVDRIVRIRKLLHILVIDICLRLYNALLAIREIDINVSFEIFLAAAKMEFHAYYFSTESGASCQRDAWIFLSSQRSGGKWLAINTYQSLS